MRKNALGRSLTAAAVACTVSLAATAIPAWAQDANTVKIGVLTDMSGPYSAMGGQGSVVAAKMAVEDCLKNECKGMKIEILSADNQNKPDVGVTRAREWLDRDKVEAIADLTNSSVALAVQKLIKDKGGIAMYSGPATGALTTAECAPNGFHWMFDTYSQAAGAAAALTKLGNKSWYFVTVDYAFGHSLEKDASDVVKANGGTVVGSVRHPLNASDFSSFLLQAQASKAQVIGLADGGTDVVNAIKQARSFAVGGKDQRLVALLVFLSDVHALGLEAAQGLVYTDGFYWDYDEQTRAFSKRFESQFKNIKPTMVQAGVYSSVYQFLKARAAAKTSDWKVVAQKMREIPIADAVMRNASIRPDGRVIHDMYLYQVKTPAESKGPWDYLKLLSVIPAQQAFRPMDAACPLVKQ
ncbi:ABC transporter substrate-binding protein [Herbaspirillum seropedicae]|uniref:ABC-type branched-chain amino acid transport system,periplasmic component protein n=3 Tax=Herbaspirillum seropedicae TaxID=964 RepID=D8J0K0_HERSS|nr:ABC transporter substrate-binding protein [Herbaspirillum seropedicae]ADJ64556.1 ABC-type branched-chain amino acid transport system,periplasmic component protein [Herbaspirillum seropedicae SmR1]AKN66484.1 ABC transporter permease [Herbaspirillum seropedicae]AON55299.1 branched-chain amino acid ABC transporter periplasmic protein [Herbaspirillum seropedicae]MDR6393625.1 branched-chain amino acid transport system substrate-binding protein [Herbaspirillum seropedicae]NQE30415.1 ABC transport